MSQQIYIGSNGAHTADSRGFAFASAVKGRGQTGPHGAWETYYGHYNGALGGWLEAGDLSGGTSPVETVWKTGGDYYANGEWSPAGSITSSMMYTISVAAGSGGTVSGGGDFISGATYTIKATPGSGYRFVSWSDGDTNATRTLTASADASYTATFEQLGGYSVSYNLGGGTHGSTHPSSAYLDTNFTVGNPTHAGYSTFDGWRVTVGLNLGRATWGPATGQMRKFQSADEICKGASFTLFRNLGVDGGAVTLTANWSGGRSFAVTLDQNGGSGGTDTAHATYGSAMPSVVVPSRTGYVFQGYFDTAGESGGTQYYTASGNSARAWDRTSAATLHARWTQKTYVFTFKANGGTLNGSSSDVTIPNASYPVAPTYGSSNCWYVQNCTAPARDHYDFAGFFTMATGGEKVWYGSGVSRGGTYWSADGSAGRYIYDGDLTVYAHWTPKSYTVTIADLPEGCTATVDGGAQHAYGSDVTITAAPASGYRLSGARFYDSGTGEQVGSETISSGNVATISGIACDVRAVLSFEARGFTAIGFTDEASVPHQDGATSASNTTVKVERGGQTVTDKTITPRGGPGVATQYGDTVTLEAYPDEENGYEFAGWYIQDTLVSTDNPCQISCTGDIFRRAKFKVAVTLNVVNKDEGEADNYITLDGVRVANGEPHDVVLGESVQYAVVGASYSDTRKWMLDSWRGSDASGAEVIDLPASGALTPTAPVTMWAWMVKDADRTIKAWVVDLAASPVAAVDSTAAGVAGTIYAGIPARGGTNAEPPIEANESGSPGEGETVDPSDPPLSTEAFVFELTGAEGGTRRIKLYANGSVTIGGASRAFFGWTEEYYQAAPPEGAIVSSELSLDVLLSTATTYRYAYFGTAGLVDVNLAYASGSDATMGAIAIVATNDTAQGSGIAPDGMSAKVTQARTITLSVQAKSGYTFVGWYAEPGAAGEPRWRDADSTVTVDAKRTIYAKFAQDPNSIYEWEGSQEAKPMTWRSKTYEASRPFNPSACRVDARGYAGDADGTLLELTVDMFSAPDAEARPTASATLDNIANQNARRLPVRRMERYMQVEVRSNAEVDALLVGTSMGGLAV